MDRSENTSGMTKSHIIRITDQEFTTLANYVKDNYGIDLTKKRILIESRLTPDLRRHGFTNFQQYIDMLFKEKSETEIVNLLNKLTTNLSYFMRENEHFNYLFSQVLPYLERTRTNRELRIWSAGCSTGQEAYNIQMVIDEYFGARKAHWDTTMLATDISMRVLNKGQKGIYTADELKDLPANWKSKYTVALPDGTFQIIEALRKQVIFRPGNLMEPFNFKKPFDLIFCRNVMIYFDEQTKAELVNKFYNWTAPDGYLFIGHSENINNLRTRYTYIQPAIYQRRDGFNAH